ncbi:hypothetical protein SNE40_007523 [Patella caerulea]|uniref:SOCS box domain-containing protein n=1 Tax=Patella caerulea TaxID=87958 RepID=A0AAN8PXK4_PATCE
MEKLHEFVMRGQFTEAVQMLTDLDKIDATIGQNLLYNSIKYYESYIQSCHQDDTICKRDIVKSLVVAQSETRFQLLKLIQCLFKMGVNPNFVVENGTLLMTAVATRDESLLQMLLSNGADPNLFGGRRDMNAFSLSIIINDVSIVELFLHNGANVNSPCCGTMTPLQLSVNKCVEISKMLLQHGANIQQVLNVSGINQVQLADPPLIQAVRSENPYLTALLLECGEDINQVHGQREDTAFHIAIKQGNKEIVEILIRNGANLDKENARGHTPLGLALLAAGSKSNDIVKMILNAGCSRTKTTSIALFQKTYPPLFVACFLGNLNIVKFLLEEDTAMNIPCDLHCYCNNGRYEHEFEEPAISSKSKSPPLAQDSLNHLDLDGDDIVNKFDHLNVCDSVKKKKMCAKKTKYLANLVASDGSTPLMLATFGGKLEMVEYLLDHGADHTITNKHGNLVHAAVVSTGSIKFLDIVVNLGCDINMVSNAGNTPLLLSSRINKPEMCLYLIQKGAYLNHRDRFGETALSASIYFGCEDNAKLLIQHGADLDIADSSGTTAFYWSIFNYRESIIRRLIDAGAYFTPEHLAKYPRNLKFMKNKQLIEWIKGKISNPKTLVDICVHSVRKVLSKSNVGRSIYHNINTLPLPSTVKQRLKFIQ